MAASHCARTTAVVVVLLAAAALTPSRVHAEKRQPLFLDSLYSWQPVDTIAVLPWLDGREDRQADLEKARKLVKDAIKNSFGRKQYKSAFVWEATPDTNIYSVEGFSSADWVPVLPSMNSRWALIVCWEHTMSRTGLWSHSDVVVSGAIYDLRERQLIWRDQGVGKRRGGGLLSGLFAGLDTAAWEAISDMLKTVPKRPRGKS